MAMGKIRRRDFVKWSAASLSALGVGMPPFLRRALGGVTLNPKKKVLFIFLRGGMDGIQAVIPYGDGGVPGDSSTTYAGARPTLAPNMADTHDLNGFAALYPTMQGPGASDPKLADIFHDTFDGRGANLAVMHRIGYASQNRSHFSSQQFYENAIPGDVATEEGWLNRYLQAYPDAASPLQAATLNNNQVVMLKGSTLVPVLRSISDFALPTNVPLGLSPGGGGPLGSGLKGAYGQSGFNPGVPYNSLTYETGVSLLDNLQFFEDNVSGNYVPEGGAEVFYDAMVDGRFRGFVRDCAQLLKEVEGLQIAGCNFGGFDNHGNLNTVFPELVRDLGLALTALYVDLAPIWDDLLIFTLTEFGRTSRQNANVGTDHAAASVMFAMGGNVNGGAYNCDFSTWPDGAMFEVNNRYLSHRTDFRAVYNEMITRHLGDPSGQIDSVIPNFTALESANAGGYFTPLNFLQG